MAEDRFGNILLKAIDEMLIVSIEQFGMTDLNKDRNVSEAYDLNSIMAEAVRAFPPENHVRTVYFQIENGAVADLKYDYSDRPVPPESIGFIIDRETTTRLTKNHFYGSG